MQEKNSKAMEDMLQRDANIIGGLGEKMQNEEKNRKGLEERIERLEEKLMKGESHSKAIEEKSQLHSKGLE